LLVSLIKDRNYDDIAQRCREYVITHHNPVILARKLIKSL